MFMICYSARRETIHVVLGLDHPSTTKVMNLSMLSTREEGVGGDLAFSLKKSQNNNISQARGILFEKYFHANT